MDEHERLKHLLLGEELAEQQGIVAGEGEGPLDQLSHGQPIFDPLEFANRLGGERGPFAVFRR